MFKWSIVTALIIAGLVLTAGTTTPAFAQGPVASAAAYLDNQPHTIGPGGTQWYYFNRGDDSNTVTVTLVNGVSLGLAFNVYAPDRPDPPIGRGTSSNVICNGSDKCPSPDLTWTGGANSPGRYSVQVINNGSNATSYLLTLSGGGTAPVQGYTYYYYYAPYGVPYTQPYYVPPPAPKYVPPPAPKYVPPYYVPPQAPQYVPPYQQPYYGPGYYPPYRPYYPPCNYSPWYCR